MINPFSKPKLSSKDIPMDDVDYSEGIKATKTYESTKDIHQFFDSFHAWFKEDER